MNDDPLVWIIGRGGLLGTALVRLLDADSEFDAPPIPWGSPSAHDVLRAAAADFDREVRSGRRRSWVVVWSAGAGVIGTSAEQLAEETALLSTVLESLAVTEAGTGVVVLASSAGGVYGGVTSMPVTEESPTRSLSPYGSNKLLQESMLGEWASRSGQRAAIARIANLYGPGQSLTKRQGLISQICLGTMLRRPIPIYVSMDTLRDYIYVDDCAGALVDLIRRAGDLEPSSTVVKIVASGASVSIGTLLAECGRVLGRSPTIVTASTTNTALQSSVLAFRSNVWTGPPLRMTPLPVGIHRTAQDIRRQLREGALGAGS